MIVCFIADGFKWCKEETCLLSNTCLGLGVEAISRLEHRLEGLQWNNVASPLSADDDFNMAWVFGMLLIDAIGYMILHGRCIIHVHAYHWLVWYHALQALNYPCH